VRQGDNALEDLQVHEVEREGKLAEAHQHRTPKRRPVSLEVGGGGGGDQQREGHHAGRGETHVEGRVLDQWEGDETDHEHRE
jgi:hypothetical protein